MTFRSRAGEMYDKAIARVSATATQAGEHLSRNKKPYLVSLLATGAIGAAAAFSYIPRSHTTYTPEEGVVHTQRDLPIKWTPGEETVMPNGVMNGQVKIDKTLYDISVERSGDVKVTYTGRHGRQFEILDKGGRGIIDDVTDSIDHNQSLTPEELHTFREENEGLLPRVYDARVAQVTEEFTDRFKFPDLEDRVERVGRKLKSDETGYAYAMSELTPFTYNVDGFRVSSEPVTVGSGKQVVNFYVMPEDNTEGYMLTVDAKQGKTLFAGLVSFEQNAKGETVPKGIGFNSETNVEHYLLPDPQEALEKLATLRIENKARIDGRKYKPK